MAIKASAGLGTLAAALGLLAAGACGGSKPAPTVQLTPAELKDPATCQGCHPAQFAQWSNSMHAYAADDPIFLAMNKRGQRETGGALGAFCVQCHAPMAVRDNLTTDGLNLATLPAAEKGVTCFFCHSAASIDSSHDANDNPLILATDGSLFGPISDPVAGIPHAALYSALLDDAEADSARACGTCHDIVNQHGVALERTFQEWQATLFAIPPHGLTCATNCHMASSDGPASTVSNKSRPLHNHEFPAVDIALTAFPGADPAAQAQDAQALLDSVLQGTICLDEDTQQIQVALDNVGAGHAWPSGASQDRRAWVEVTASAAGQVIYQSGVQPGETIEAAADPDLWLLRDCIYDAGVPPAEVHMFWEAASDMSNLIPGSVMATLQDPSSFTKSHLRSVYPGAGPLPSAPDTISLQVFLQAVGDDVLRDLTTNPPGAPDLDPAVAAAVPRYRLGNGAQLTWTPATATPIIDSQSGDRLSCVVVGTYTPIFTVPMAVSHRRCL
jgi:hypothetical protein